MRLLVLSSPVLSSLVLSSLVLSSLVLSSLVLSSLVLSSCAYPRRATTLAAVPPGNLAGAPDALWTLRLVRASVPPGRRGGGGWDDGDGKPDPYVRLYRDDALVFESPVIEDTLSPAFELELPRNVLLPSSAKLRFELWDEDGVSDDPIGVWRGTGLPASALPDADALVRMDSSAELVSRITAPRAHRGVGIPEYEVRADRLEVISVLPHSPAGRAGIQPGDAVVAIAGVPIATMTEAEAATALSLAVERRSVVTVTTTTGERAELPLDQGYVWLAM
jgi:membrane-associated protease RseP (regulator of RpoE activity)